MKAGQRGSRAATGHRRRTLSVDERSAPLPRRPAVIF